MKLPTRYWRYVINISFVVYVSFSLVFVFRGELNTDEGWYLYAGKLVYQGRIPYQDFAYTQTPLLPYIYGAAQLMVGYSLYSGRLLTVFISFLAMVFALNGAKKGGGLAAAALTALLWSTHTFGIYYQTITKTYALTTLFFSMSLYFLLIRERDDRYLVAAAIAALLATLTRLSGLFFALPILIYVFVMVDVKHKRILLVCCMTAVAALAWMAYPNVDAFLWNLFIHHTAQWGDISVADRFAEIFRPRLVMLLTLFPAYSMLFFFAVLLGWRTLRKWLRFSPPLLVVFVGLALFAIPNLTSGGFHAEYFTPLFFAFFPLISVLLVETLGQPASESEEMTGLEGVARGQDSRREGAGHLWIMLKRVGLQAIFLTAVIIGAVRGGTVFIDTSGGRLPIEEVQEVAAILESISAPEQQIFVMEALTAVYEAGRWPLPNMTMAHFSYYPGETATAREYHLVSDEMILEYLRQEMPAAVILTDQDRRILESSPKYAEISAALAENYAPQFQMESFGQFKDTVRIYVRDNDLPDA